MEIKRSYILIEDYKGNIYRVASSQEEQLKALRLLANLKEDGELPIMKDNNVKIKKIDPNKINKIK